MNGKYSVASGNRQDVAFNDDYAAKGHEYFDVWGPEIATHYAEVFWTDQGNNPLPDQIVKRFAGKTIAITGYEMDQVMVSPLGMPGVLPKDDVSVPINWAYNHHYMMWITGEHSELQTVKANPQDVSAHGAPKMHVLVDKPSARLRADTSIPTGQMFSEGNGGESRKSFHGYPDGYAQLIDSPTLWHVTPMQIDTRNRDCGATRDDIHKCVKFVPGPEPRQARYGFGIPEGGTNYSGVLECPCNSRYGGDPAFYPESHTKVQQRLIVASPTSCAASRQTSSAADCFAAAASRLLGINATRFVNESVVTSSLPHGCSVTTYANGTAVTRYNTAGSSDGCTVGGLRSGAATSTINVKFGISLDSSLPGGLATLRLSGPADVWFGVGLDADAMADAPYTIVVNASGVIEQKIGTCGSEAEHCPGDPLASSVKVLSNTVVDGKRTVVITRPFKGLTRQHYSFNMSRVATLNFITAVGYSHVFAYHKSHAAASLTLTEEGAPTCVCDMGLTNKLCETGGVHCASFTKNCVPPPPHYPFGDLLAQHNPTCNSQQYGGGLQCCHHGRIMLDDDQEIRPELLRYHMKFRFWFQEYSPQIVTAPASHANLERIYYQTEANAGEYDIPPAFARPAVPIPGYPNWPLGVPTPGTTCSGTCPTPDQPTRFGSDCECIHTIAYHWSITNKSLVYAGGHCHAPSCIDIRLFDNSTGTPNLLCRQASKYGAGNFPLDKWDEAGYIALPPCLWGRDKGLDATPWLGVNAHIFSIKRNRNTHAGHYGEMASWQMRGVSFPVK